MCQPMEQLEQRAMLSSVNLYPDGTLMIAGSNFNDTIILERANIPQLGGDRITVSLKNPGSSKVLGMQLFKPESITAQFLTTQVKRILIQCQGGDDQVLIATNIPICQPTTVFGGTGNDGIAVWGSSGRNLLYGEDGNDVLWGGTNNDTIMGGAGDDVISGSAGNDSLSGGAGNDRIFGSDGDDSIDGGAGSDHLEGGDGNDFILAGPTVGDGIDTLVGGAGRDTLVGRDGKDELVDIVHGLDVFARF